MDEVLKEGLKRWDLEVVRRMVDREADIRQTMSRTGEGRAVVEEMVDAYHSMSAEAVTDLLMDGEVTTLPAALQKLADEISAYEEDMVSRDVVAGQILMLLDRGWPGEEAVLYSHLRNGALKPRMSVVSADQGNTAELQIDGLPVWAATMSDFETFADAAEFLLNGLYDALLRRIIADRDHIVQVHRRDVEDLVRYLTSTLGGSWRPRNRHSRVSVDAVAGGGALIRTRPYGQQLG
jgi:hypothetical protein